MCGHFGPLRTSFFILFYKGWFIDAPTKKTHKDVPSYAPNDASSFHRDAQRYRSVAQEFFIHTHEMLQEMPQRPRPGVSLLTPLFKLYSVLINSRQGYLKSSNQGII